MAAIEIKVPDIGDFKDIPVLEVLVKPGDTVTQEDSLLTLESDKATMEVPSTHSGVVKEVRVKAGDKVSQGSTILLLDVADAAKPSKPADHLRDAPPAPAAEAPASPLHPRQRRTRCVRNRVRPDVCGRRSPRPCEPRCRFPRGRTGAGRGAGGYHGCVPCGRPGQEGRPGRALRDSRRGMPQCGRIPQAAAHAARVIAETPTRWAISASPSAPPGPDLESCRLEGWHRLQLTKGLAGLAKARKVTVVEGKRNSPRPRRSRSNEGRPQGRLLRQLHHRGRLPIGAHPGFPYEDPRSSTPPRPPARGHPQAPADHRRRHHRPGDGDRVRRALGRR